MDLGIDFISVLSGFFWVISGLWPLWILLVISGTKSRSRIAIWQGLWILLVLSWVGARLFPMEGVSLIPEPWNSIIFWFAVLLSFTYFVREYLRRSPRKSVLNIEFNPMTDISPEQFEYYVGEIFRLRGHKVQMTGNQGDHGVDLIVHLENGEKWVAQCKQWKGSVGEPAVRDLYGAMHHAGADRASLITTGTFTTQARIWAKGKSIELIDGDRLAKITSVIREQRAKD